MIITKECLSVVIHDTSLTGIRYKLRVQLDRKVSKAKLGHEVLDTSNNLYRAIHFSYAMNPTVEVENKKTVFYYYFNDVGYANRLAKFLGQELDSEVMQKHLIEHAKRMQKDNMPTYVRPYLDNIQDMD